MNSPPADTAKDRRLARAIRRLRSRRWAVAATVAIPLVLAGCDVPNFGAYRGATKQAQDTFKLWQGFVIAGIILGAIVSALIIWAVIRYRRKSDALPHQTQYHTVMEILYTSIPILIVLALFAFTVVTENEVTATPKSSVKVEVTAFQWGWQFYYPSTGKIVEGTTTQAPQMVLPVGVDANIVLRSADVVHGFYVPQFNFSEYAQPGYANRFNFDVVRKGVFRGQCTQLCGLYHSLMFFSVRGVSQAQFQTWVHQGVTSHSASIAQLKNQIRSEGPGA